MLMKSIEVDRNKRYRTAREFYQAFRYLQKDKDTVSCAVVETDPRWDVVALLGISIVTVGYGVHEIKLEKTEK